MVVVVVVLLYISILAVVAVVRLKWKWKSELMRCSVLVAVVVMLRSVVSVVYLSIYLSFSIYLFDYLQVWKPSFSAIHPHFFNLTALKQHFCETSSMLNWLAKVINEAILRDPLNCRRGWQHQNGTILRDFLQKWKISAEPMASCQCGFWSFQPMCVKDCACHEKVRLGHTKCCTCHAKAS